MSKYDGGPAFPHPNGQIEKGTSWMRIPFAHGMTQRAYIATAAMQGFVASTGVVGGPVPTAIDIARWSVEQADALLAELEAK